MHDGCAQQEHPGDIEHGEDAQCIAAACLLIYVVAYAFVFGFFDGVPCPHFFEAWVHAFGSLRVRQHLMGKNRREVLNRAGNGQTAARRHVFAHELFLFALKVFHFGRRIAHRIQIFTELMMFMPVNSLLFDEALHLR